MSRVERIKTEIQRMSAKELAMFRAWFAEFDWQAWDRQFAEDVKAGKLDALASVAASGRVHDSGVVQPGIPAEHAQSTAGIPRAGSIARFLVRLRSAIHADPCEAGPVAGGGELIVDAVRY